MNEPKPAVTNAEACCVENYQDPNCSTWDGEYRERLDFILPYNGKRRRIIRFNASVNELNYMQECIKKAKTDLKARILAHFEEHDG